MSVPNHPALFSLELNKQQKRKDVLVNICFLVSLFLFSFFVEVFLPHSYGWYEDEERRRSKHFYVKKCEKIKGVKGDEALTAK